MEQQGTNDVATEEAKILKLREIMRQLWVPGYSTQGHGTSENVIQSIMENGLECRSWMLGSTTVPIFNQHEHYDEEPDTTFQRVLHWPHRDYKCIVIVQIPNPGAGDIGEPGYFNRVIEPLPEEKKVNVGVQGADRSDVIPTKFIMGYIDVDNLTFIENEKYDPTAKIRPFEPQKPWSLVPPSPLEDITETTKEDSAEVLGGKSAWLEEDDW